MQDVLPTVGLRQADFEGMGSIGSDSRFILFYLLTQKQADSQGIDSFGSDLKPS